MAFPSGIGTVNSPTGFDSEFSAFGGSLRPLRRRTTSGLDRWRSSVRLLRCAIRHPTLGDHLPTATSQHHIREQAAQPVCEFHEDGMERWLAASATLGHRVCFMPVSRPSDVPQRAHCVSWHSFREPQAGQGIRSSSRRANCGSWRRASLWPRSSPAWPADSRRHRGALSLPGSGTRPG